MGPLLPISILLGSFWYLDRERERQEPAAAAPPKFSPLAVGRVAGLVEGVRTFHEDISTELDPLLSSSGVQPVELEGMPPGVSIFRLAPLVPGAASASALIATALRSGHVVLGSLALALGGSPDQQLLLVGGPEAKRYANGRSAFALLADIPAPIVAEPEPPAPAPKKRKVMNGAPVVAEPATPEETTVEG